MSLDKDYIWLDSVAVLGRGAFAEVSLKRLKNESDKRELGLEPDAAPLIAVKHIVRQDAVLAGRVDRILIEKKALDLIRNSEGTMKNYCVRLLDTYKNEITLGFVYEPVYGGKVSILQAIPFCIIYYFILYIFSF